MKRFLCHSLPCLQENLWVKSSSKLGKATHKQRLWALLVPLRQAGEVLVQAGCPQHQAKRLNKQPWVRHEQDLLLRLQHSQIISHTIELSILTGKDLLSLEACMKTVKPARTLTQLNQDFWGCKTKHLSYGLIKQIFQPFSGVSSGYKPGTIWVRLRICSPLTNTFWSNFAYEIWCCRVLLFSLKKFCSEHLGPCPAKYLQNRRKKGIQATYKWICFKQFVPQNPSAWTESVEVPSTKNIARNPQIRPYNCYWNIKPLKEHHKTLPNKTRKNVQDLCLGLQCRAAKREPHQRRYGLWRRQAQFVVVRRIVNW